jgi:integrase
VYQYAGKLAHLLEWIKPLHLKDVAVGDLEAWANRKRDGRAHGQRGSAATLSRDMTVLRGLYKYACARWPETFHKDPTALLAPPTVHNKNPKPVPDDTWTQAWGSVSLPTEARVVFGLGYLCGLRRGEIAVLRRDQVMLNGQRLVAFKRKGGGDDVLDYGELVGLVADTLPSVLPGGAESFLEPFTAHVSGLLGDCLFDWASPHAIYKRMAKWFRAVDLPPNAFTPHQLRHSFVTNLLRCDVPIALASVLANHTSPNVTMRYAKLGGGDLRSFRARRQGLQPSDYR